MSIYCPLAEALGIKATISILDIKDEYESHSSYVPGAFTGQKHTEETKQRMSGKRKPYGPQSVEHKNNISESRKGAKQSEETKRLLSILNLGEKNRFYGKTHTSEAKEKIRIGNKNNVSTCPVCGKTMNTANYKKYKHGTECKKGL